MKTPRAALYARISQEDANIPSVENQLENLRALAAKLGAEIVAEHSDNDISGYSGKQRPGFRDLLLTIEDGRTDLVLAVAVDRLARNDVESFAIRRASIQAKVRWHTLATGEIDPTTATGAFNAALFAALAELESGLKAERARRSVNDRLNLGLPLVGNRVFGFETDRLTLRTDEAELIRTAYSRMLDAPDTLSPEDRQQAPWTLYKVARDWNARGHKTTDAGRSSKKRGTGGRERVEHDGMFTTEAIKRILTNPRMAGILTHKGEELASDGLPAIVSRERLDAMEAFLANPARKQKPGQKATNLLSGVMLCPCGNPLSAGSVGAKSTVKGKVYKYSYHVYRCRKSNTPGNTSGHATVRVTEADEWVTNEALKAIAEERVTVSGGGYDRERITAIYAALGEKFRQIEHVQALLADPDLVDEQTAFKARLKVLKGEREALEIERDRLTALSAEGGALSEFLAYMQGLPNYDDIEASIAEGSTAEQRAAFWKPAIGWAKGYEAWEGTPVEKRREILRGSFIVKLSTGRGAIDTRISVEAR
ncbi:recombinase family protein [Microcella humidisoli]|uniref:Recombinase family protein n=1 Tax=Microcella humidisoli TaxID=2963406 RepID=A0ABY5FWV6_9MICO|nr:recombinase family protein [Microcella humidisoli]UTT62540.1 recombinase family protein [Microcella humidisoli]UTT62553.1 recombinase family protein [Microcella humidisoli]